MDSPVWDRSIKLYAHRTTNATEVLAELRAMVDRASPANRFQCPDADIHSLLTGVVPPEVHVIVGTLTPERATNASVWNGFSSAVFRDVELSRLLAVSYLRSRFDGASFSDYVTFGNVSTAEHPPRLLLPQEVGDSDHQQ